MHLSLSKLLFQVLTLMFGGEGLESPVLENGTASVEAASTENTSSEKSSTTVQVDKDRGSRFWIVPENAPEWIRNSAELREDGTRAFPILIASAGDQEFEGDEFAFQMREEVAKYLDENVLLGNVKSGQLSELTHDYISNHWLAPEHRFESTIELGSSQYKQTWLLVTISPDELSKLKQWENRYLTQERGRGVGVLGGIAILGMLGFSGGVGILARREQAKLKG